MSSIRMDIEVAAVVNLFFSDHGHSCPLLDGTYPFLEDVPPLQPPRAPALNCTALHCTALHEACVFVRAWYIWRGALPHVFLKYMCLEQCEAQHPGRAPVGREVRCSWCHQWWAVAGGPARGACSAVHCSAVHCSAVQCSAVQCSAVQCSAVQCSAVQCSAVHQVAVLRPAVGE
jgi:hypothetical protein